MAKSAEEVKESLLRENEEFQRLARRHRELEDRLSYLSNKTFLSEAEKLEEVTLKKKKLVLKDRMAEIIRQHRAEPVAERSSPTDSPSASL